VRRFNKIVLNEFDYTIIMLLVVNYTRKSRARKTAGSQSIMLWTFPPFNTTFDDQSVNKCVPILFYFKKNIPSYDVAFNGLSICDVT